MPVNNPAIREFYDAQNNFHNDMRRLVDYVENKLIPNTNDPLKQDQLKFFIAPYKELTQNPFGKVKETEADCLTEIKHVLQDNFSNMQQAYITSARNLTDFQAFLKDNFSPEIASLVDRRNMPSLLTGEIAKPIQHTTRYELVVREINKKIPSPDLLETTKGISESINSAAKTATANKSDEITAEQMRKYRDQSRSAKTRTPLRAASIFPAKKEQLRDMKQNEKLLQEQMQREVQQNKKRP